MNGSRILLIAGVILLLGALVIVLSDRGSGGALATIGAALVAMGLFMRKPDDDDDA